MSQFEIYQDSTGEFHWRFRASNDSVVAVSPEAFKTIHGCRHSIELLMMEASNAEIERTVGSESTT